MSKKSGTGKSAKRKARFELRLDDDVYQRVKAVSQEADISINQLIQGVLRWAMMYAHPGEADYVEKGGCEVVEAADVPGCVWFGRSAGEDDGGFDEGTIIFQLDFSERHVVRTGI